jgi:hypothetical protein
MEKKPLNEGNTRGQVKGGVSETGDHHESKADKASACSEQEVLTQQIRSGSGGD